MPLASPYLAACRKTERKSLESDSGNLSARVGPVALSFPREAGDTFFEIISRQNSPRMAVRAHRPRWDGTKISPRNIGFESYVRGVG